MSSNKDLLDSFYGWLTGVMLEARRTREPAVASTQPIAATALLPQQRLWSETVVGDTAVQMARSASS